MTSSSARTVLDAELEGAIKEAVRQQGQDPKVATRLIAWLTELSLGGTSVENKSEVREQFDNLSAALTQGSIDDEG